MTGAYKSANGRIVPSVSEIETRSDCQKLRPIASQSLSFGSRNYGVSLPDLSGSTGSINSATCEVKSFHGSSAAVDYSKTVLTPEPASVGRLSSKRLSDAGEYRLKSAASAIRGAVANATKTPVALKTRQTIKSIQDMMCEKRNVARHGKVQKLFRVDSEGGPHAGEEQLSPSMARVVFPSRFRRLFDRRVDYMSTRLYDSDYSSQSADIRKAADITALDTKMRRRTASDTKTPSPTGTALNGRAKLSTSRSVIEKQENELKLPPLTAVKMKY